MEIVIFDSLVPKIGLETRPDRLGSPYSATNLFLGLRNLGRGNAHGNCPMPKTWGREVPGITTMAWQFPSEESLSQFPGFPPIWESDRRKPCVSFPSFFPKLIPKVCLSRE